MKKGINRQPLDGFSPFFIGSIIFFEGLIMDFADLKVSVPNAITSALMVMVVFLIFKYLFVNRIYVPGWSEAVGAL